MQARTQRAVEDNTTMTVRTQVAVNGIEMTTGTHEKVEQNLEASRNNGIIIREIHEIVGSLANNMMNLPRNMGYAWPGISGPTERVIHFEDATGNVVQLLMDLCKDYEVYKPKPLPLVHAKT
jgi:hypothetical protein